MDFDGADKFIGLRAPTFRKLIRLALVDVVFRGSESQLHKWKEKSTVKRYVPCKSTLAIVIWMSRSKFLRFSSSILILISEQNQFWSTLSGLMVRDVFRFCFRASAYSDSSGVDWSFHKKLLSENRTKRRLNLFSAASGLRQVES